VNVTVFPVVAGFDEGTTVIDGYGLVATTADFETANPAASITVTVAVYGPAPPVLNTPVAVVPGVLAGPDQLHTQINGAVPPTIFDTLNHACDPIPTRDGPLTV